MSSLRLRRLVGVSATVVLAVGVLAPSAVTGANTRSLWIGAPPLIDPLTGQVDLANSGHLFPTVVSIPAPSPAPVNATMFQVEVASTDNQTLAHVVLTINAGTVQGLTFETVYDPAGGNLASLCTAVANTITCNYGNIEAYGSRTIAVVVDVDSTYPTTPQVGALFSASVTTNNENGTNQQTFAADSGSFAVGPFSADSLNTFVPPGQAKKLATSPLGSGNNLSTTVGFTAPSAETVAMTEGNSTTKYICPPLLSCQPQYSEVITSTGFFSQSPYFHWTLTALVPKTYSLSQGFVAHYLDNTSTPDWTLLFKNKSSFCGSLEITSNGHCIKTLSLSKPVNGWETLTIEVVMDHQGGLRI